MTQTVKNLPAMPETHVQSLGQEDSLVQSLGQEASLEEEVVTHSSILT